MAEFHAQAGGLLPVEHTLVMIKPDAVANGDIGGIISGLEDIGKITDMKMKSLTTMDVAHHYAHHVGKDFYDALEAFMMSEPVVLIELMGVNVVANTRHIVGLTNPKEGARNTIRAQYGTDLRHNAIHCSDSREAAVNELKYFFGKPPSVEDLDISV